MAVCIMIKNKTQLNLTVQLAPSNPVFKNLPRVKQHEKWLTKIRKEINNSELSPLLE